MKSSNTPGNERYFVIFLLAEQIAILLDFFSFHFCTKLIYFLYADDAAKLLENGAEQILWNG